MIYDMIYDIFTLFYYIIYEVHSQLQMCALPWRRAFNYYKIYKYGEKTKLLIRIYTYNISCTPKLYSCTEDVRIHLSVQ